MKKHYLVYKTTCLLNGKIYIGQHQTYDPNDNYLGSGRDLKEDIRKFGSENFKREILFDFDNFTDMDNKEKELVTEEFVNREDTYNVRLGGQNPEVDKICQLGRDKIHQLLEFDEEWTRQYRNKNRIVIMTARREHPERFANSGWGKGTKNPRLFLGKHHSEETKHKIGEKNKQLVGERNGSFGTVWIYNESLEQNKKVKKEQVDDFLKQGWKLGRKLIFNR